MLLEKAMAPHSSTLAWKIPWKEEPGGLQSLRSHRVGHDGSNLAVAAAGGTSGKESTCHTQVQSPGLEDLLGRGHGNLFEYSFLKKPMGRGAWWATVLGVAKSQT